MPLRLFETMLVLHGRIVQAQEHFERMAASAAALGLAAPDAERFRRELAAALPAEALRCDYDGQRLAAHPRRIPPHTLARRAHGRAITLPPSMARILPEHKLAGVYGVCELGLRLALDAGADEALFVTRDGRVLEGTATNVFAVAGQAIVTAPERVLPGVTRAWVLREAAALGIAIEERAPTVAELGAGAFLTGSLTTLAPLRMLDGRRCLPPGEVYDALAARWSTLHACAVSPPL